MEAPIRTVVRETLCLLMLIARSGAALEAQRQKPAPAEAQTISVIDQVVHDLCDRRIALLGEAPMHGFGKTLEFKAEVARRLVSECHYRAFFIESGAYSLAQIKQLAATGNLPLR